MDSTVPSTPELSPPPLPGRRYSAGTALLVSLIVPGAGQVYCGAKARGAWTLVFFVAGILLTVIFASLGPTGEPVAGIALRTALVLYGFAFLDAYFTAREKNAGDWEPPVYQPRLAAALNLCTRGFGYWYVDERERAFGAFFGLGIVNFLVNQTSFGGLAFELVIEGVLAIMALDAYRLAKEGNELRGIATKLAVSSVPAAVPLTAAGIMVLSYVGLAVLGMLMSE